MNLKTNNQIRAREVRLVGEKNEQLGVMPLQKARDTANNAGLDLVEIAPTQKPPVCRLLDYGKYCYELNKKESAQRKKQKSVELREIRLRPKIDEHDLDTKINQMKKFLADGDKVKITIMYRGREMQHADLGWKLLEKTVKALENLIAIEQQPKMEGTRMFMVAAPKKNQNQKQNLPQKSSGNQEKK